jgi:hypothetical protein
MNNTQDTTEKAESVPAAKEDAMQINGTVRQLFYRLVGVGLVENTERAYETLCAAMKL